jgi:hypothetical protein
MWCQSENYWNRKNPTIFLLRLIRSIGPIVKFHGWLENCKNYPDKKGEFDDVYYKFNKLILTL